MPVRAVDLHVDDGITIPVPILLEGEESVVEFIDLPYSGVSFDFCTLLRGRPLGVWQFSSRSRSRTQHLKAAILRRGLDSGV